MDVNLLSALSDDSLLPNQVNQRQLSIAVSAIASGSERNAPLNLCLILDHSGSMSGEPLETVKQAAQSLVDRLQASDRLSVVVFDHAAKVLIASQLAADTAKIKAQIGRLEPQGGTAIDQGMKLGIEQLADQRQGKISQAFLLTDGENEHGDNQRCLQFAELAASYNITLNAFGFGYHWNQDILEQIADAGGGSLTFIERPEDAVNSFNALFTRISSVGLTNAHLLFTFSPGVKLAELKPIAQVMPETVELPVQSEGETAVVRIGDLLIDSPRKLLANLYIDPQPEGLPILAYLQVRYDDPASSKTSLLSERIPITVKVSQDYQPKPNPEVQQSILTLAKYRQTQIAEAKLNQGDRTGAATMLQSAAETALQMGDKNAATVLQANATRLQSGADLSESDRKKTRMASKTMLQDNN
ncbi:MAG: VWA domain-containing protein [Aphanocapsa sp. GSE-SYN-MK-11-07L]|jgi:Ca-activated chloride channel family protein|nr:VWA domain-containing protein [Aphanocapsa sp. GSE-SYN-MK-11-07L]